MPVNISRYLTHVGQYAPRSSNAFGDATYSTTPTTISCFAYFGMSETDRNRGMISADPVWNIVLPNAMATSITAGDRVFEIRDATGSLVDRALQDAQATHIDDITIYRHHKHGVQFVGATLRKNV